MGDLVHFMRLFDQKIHSQLGIELIFEENVQVIRLTFHIQLVSFKILIFAQFMVQNLIYLVRMPKYGHIVFCL